MRLGFMLSVGRGRRSSAVLRGLNEALLSEVNSQLQERGLRPGTRRWRWLARPS